MRKRLLTFLCLLLGMGGVIHAQDYEIDQRFTSIATLVSNGTLFTIVNETESKAFCFKSNHNLNYEDYTTAYSSNSYQFIVEAAQGTGVNGKYYLRSRKPDGTAWEYYGGGGYLNSQPGSPGCCFSLGITAYPNGQDVENGGVWEIEPNTDGNKFALKNVGTSKYLKNTESAHFDDPTYFTFCTLKEVVIPFPASQSDVTSTYLKNADFSAGNAIDNHVCTFGKDMAGNNTTYYGAQPISEWTNASAGYEDNGYQNCGPAGAVFAYGSTPWVGGAGTPAPAAGPTGDAGNAAGLCATWGQRIQYTQAVTLPAGYYKVSFDVYNSSSNFGSGKLIAKNFFGFIADNGREYCASNNTFAIGQWTTVTVLFMLSKETAGKISMGYAAQGTGNANMPHLFVDNVKIVSLSDFTDYTNKVGSAKSDWQGHNDGELKGPGCQIADGRKAGTAARYDNSANVGNQIYQTVTGLEPGAYEVELYAVSQREWISGLQHDAGDVAYVFAEGAENSKTWINARNNKHGDSNPACSGIYPDKEAPGVYSLSNVVVGEDGNLTLGIALAREKQTEWHHIQIKSLKRIGSMADAYKAAYIAAKNKAKTVDQSKEMAPSVKTALNNAISQYGSVDETSVSALKTATEALNKAADKANTSINSYAIIASGIVRTDVLDGWSCTNNNDFHINTWSNEGDGDGSGMTTPFIENWVYRTGKLGEGVFSYTLEGLEPGEVYYAQALIRSYNEETEDTPNGPDFFINNVVTKLSEKGKIFTYHNIDGDPMSGIYATLGGTATVDAEGKLTLGAKISQGSNYNWIAFKNVSIRSLTDMLNSVVAEAEGLYSRLRADVKAQLKSVVDANKNPGTSASAFEAAIKNINEAIAAAKVANRIPFNGSYYVKLANAEKYMAAGHEWGTRGVVNETGIDLSLSANADTRLVTFDSNIYNDSYSHYLGSSLYMDSGIYTWCIEEMSSDTYYICMLGENKSQYIGVDENGNLVLLDTPVAWKFLSKETVEAERMQKGLESLKAATAENGVDATFLLKDANFNRNDHRWEAWTVSEDCTNKDLGGGCSTEVFNGCAESKRSTFTISQTVSGAPSGIYVLKAQGFYKQEDDVKEAAPVFFINDVTMAVSAQTGTEGSMMEAGRSFANGDYEYTLDECKVKDELVVGIKGTAKSQWVCWDNFRLTYYGPIPAEKSQMEPVLAEAKELAADASKTEGKDELNAAITAAEESLENYSSMSFDAFKVEVDKLVAAIDAFRKIYRARLEAGKYYVQLAADSKKFMAAGSKSGTRGIVNGTGLDMTLTFNENNTANFDTNVETDGKHFMGVVGDSLRMDAEVFNWSLGKMGEDTYSISNDKQYISVDEDGLLIWSDTPEAWKIVKKEVIVNERMATLTEASPDNGVDITWMLQNPNFNRNDQRVKGWTVSKRSNHNLNGGNNENNCAESFHSTFTISQALSGLPIGVYGLKVQGFYRQDGENAEDAPEYFLNDETQPVALQTGNEGNMAQASVAFSEGMYDMEEELLCMVSNGEISIGIKGTATNQWVIFDNFRLTFYGLSEDDVTNPPVAKKQLAYTGKPQVLIEAGSHEVGEIQYSMDKENFSTELPEATEAGSYDVWYRVVDENNDLLLSIKKLVANIAPANATDYITATLVDTDTIYTYDATAKEPEVIVKGSIGKIEAGTDYVISYENNTNAGTAHVVVTGKGNYKGTVIVPFDIAKLQLTSLALADSILVYSEEDLTVAIDSVGAGEMRVPEDAYTVSGNTEMHVGSYTVTVTANEDSNFEGELTAEFWIIGRDIATCEMTLKSYKEYFTGYERKPAVIVTRGEIELTEGVDYIVSYENNINAGTALAIVTGIGNYSGTNEEEFTIVTGDGQLTMLNDTVTISYITTGFSVRPIKLTGDGNLTYTSSNEEVAQVNYKTGEITINNVGETIITAIMKNTKNATSDTITCLLVVKPASEWQVTAIRTSSIYELPAFRVTSSKETLVEGRDYTMSYKNLEGREVTEAEMAAEHGMYTAVVNLKGNYTGTIERDILVQITATDIDGVKSDLNGKIRYDMSGRRVKNYRGIVIEDGQVRAVKK